jgi:hypothetical protein
VLNNALTQKVCTTKHLNATLCTLGKLSCWNGAGGQTCINCEPGLCPHASNRKMRTHHNFVKSMSCSKSSPHKFYSNFKATSLFANHIGSWSEPISSNDTVQTRSPKQCIRSQCKPRIYDMKNRYTYPDTVKYLQSKPAVKQRAAHTSGQAKSSSVDNGTIPKSTHTAFIRSILLLLPPPCLEKLG